VTQIELAEWYDVQRRTIYSWLKRLETDEPLEQAVVDDKRTEIKRKASESQQEKFGDTVRDPPEEVGLDAPAWSPALVQQYLEDVYDVEYSLPSCRRLLKEVDSLNELTTTIDTALDQLSMREVSNHF